VSESSSIVSLDHALEAVRRAVPEKRRRHVRLSAAVRFEEDLGLSSLEVGELFVVLEELVGAELDTTQVEQTRTIGDLLRVERAEEDRAW
jgi:acyl carrier protein